MKDIFLKETFNDFEHVDLDDYETLIRMKDMELDRLFDFSEGILNADSELDEPVDADEKLRLDKIQQREADLKEVMEVLKYIYSRLKVYEEDLKQREEVVKDEYTEIKVMEETMNKVDFKVPSEIFGF